MSNEYGVPIVQTSNESQTINPPAKGFDFIKAMSREELEKQFIELTAWMMDADTLIAKQAILCESLRQALIRSLKHQGPSNLPLASLAEIETLVRKGLNDT